MKQLLLMFAVVALVGCGDSKEEKAAAAAKAAAEAKAYKAAAEANTLEAAIRRELNKPTGELTKADLDKMTRLELAYNSITDSNYKITDADLKEVAKLENLKFLWLGDKITDAGLKEVVKLEKLTFLNLYNTEITAAGLKEVAKLKQLRILEVQSTKVTKAGVAELQKALPKCKISHNAKKQLIPSRENP